MKREIKFRGKDIETEKWMYGALCKIDYNGLTSYMIVSTNRFYFGIHQAGHHCIGFDAENFCIPIIETISQFTGLYDKNGKEIYDGDILKFQGKEVYAKIFWDERVAAFFADTYAVDSHGVSFVTGIDTVGRIAESKEYEIVGNIHDNPTLLKGGNNENR